MPTPEDIARLTSLVLLATFALSALLGAIVHRTNFCTMGAISDALNMGHWDRMRQWALAAGVAMIGFGALAAWGAIRAQDAVYASPRWMWLSA
ncbi:MAG: YeeE/YedE family protein, partial [Ottowia sp.]|nr:YeeE/YedE family protein [Ottowia sp.]